MKIEDITKSIEMVNGVKTYIVDFKLLSKLGKNDKVDGKKFFDSFWKNVNFAKENDGFEIGIVKLPKIKVDTIWFHFFIYMINGKWQRVLLQNVVCEFCELSGEIANPSHPELYPERYFDKHDYFEAELSVWDLPQVRCPKCGKEFLRCAIWVKERPEDKSPLKPWRMLELYKNFEEFGDLENDILESNEDVIETKMVEKIQLVKKRQLQ